MVDRWRQVEDFFHRALERSEPDRAAFLDEACAGDEALRRDVESLLATETRSGFMERPALEREARELAQEIRPGLEGRRVGTLDPNENASAMHGRSMIGQKVAARYRVLEPLGSGGMGVVYKARDEQLGRDVALKFLPDEVSQDSQALARFRREARVASSLDHPNICTIFDVGEHGGRQFIVMQCLDGTTLRHRIQGKPLPISEIVDLGMQIADALAAAHEKRIVHRDIKSPNIFVTQRGEAKILDFGLAKLSALLKPDPDASTAAAVPARDSLTAPGEVIGTVHYMSPEQALGQEQDHRTDIFSFGVLMYEMATGRLPFSGGPVTEIVDRIVHTEPEAIARFNYDVPPELERIIRKCLEKDRGNRYQSARELFIDLRNLTRGDASLPVTPGAGPLSTRDWLRGVPGPLRIAAPATLAILILLSAYFWILRPLPAPPSERELSILPLPATVYGSADLDYLADSIPDTISYHLSKVEEIETRHSPTSMEFASLGADAVRMAELYRADYVLETTITQTPQFVFSAQLVEAGTRTLVWAEEYSGQSDDSLNLARRAAEDIVGELLPNVSKVPIAAVSANAEAERELRRGQYYSNQYESLHNLRDFETASDSLTRAFSLDGNLGDAAAEMAWLWGRKLQGGQASRLEALAQMREWSDRALSRNNESNRVWLAKAYEAENAGDQDQALRYSLRAAGSDPTDRLSHSALGSVLFRGGLLTMSLEAYREAYRVDPLYPLAHLNSAIALMQLDRPEEALSEIEQLLQLEPDFNFAFVGKSLFLITLGRLDEAIEPLECVQQETDQGRLPEAFLVANRLALSIARGDAESSRWTADSREIIRANAPFIQHAAFHLLVPFLLGHGYSELALEILEEPATFGTVPAYEGLAHSRFDLLRDDVVLNDRFERVVERSRERIKDSLRVLDGVGSDGIPEYLSTVLARSRQLPGI